VDLEGKFKIMFDGEVNEFRVPPQREEGREELLLVQHIG
jgi:hypothetical protein